MIYRRWERTADKQGMARDAAATIRIARQLQPAKFAGIEGWGGGSIPAERALRFIAPGGDSILCSEESDVLRCRAVRRIHFDWP